MKFAVRYLKNTFYPLNVPETIKLEDGIRTGLYVRDIVEEYLRNKKVVTSSDYVN